MPELRDLYQEIILEHSKNPRNFRVMETANRTAEGYNPLCGDHYTVFLDVTNDSIRDLSFQGAGCAISKASASMMTQALKNKTPAEAEEFFSRMRRAEIGHHHHISGNYLLRYAQEATWREDNRREANGAQVERLAGAAMKRKPSVDFGGYWQRHQN